MASTGLCVDVTRDPMAKRYVADALLAAVALCSSTSSFWRDLSARPPQLRKPGGRGGFYGSRGFYGRGYGYGYAPRLLRPRTYYGARCYWSPRWYHGCRY